MDPEAITGEDLVATDALRCDVLEEADVNLMTGADQLFIDLDTAAASQQHPPSSPPSAAPHLYLSPAEAAVAAASGAADCIEAVATSLQDFSLVNNNNNISSSSLSPCQKGQ